MPFEKYPNLLVLIFSPDSILISKSPSVLTISSTFHFIDLSSPLGISYTILLSTFSPKPLNINISASSIS